jgi:protease I
MANELENKTIAILVTNGFEQEELTRPRRALHDAGATTHIVSPESGKLRAWDHSDWGESFSVDVAVAEAKADDYDGLLLPGGVMNPDKLRRNPEVQRFVREFFDARKPVAAICHAPWTLIDAGVVKGRKLTSYPSLQLDLQNAGAEWVDQEVVVDKGLVTSRRPDDIPAFNEKMIEEFVEGPH